MCATRSTTKRGNIGARCDKLWAAIVKVGGHCALCGDHYGLEAAHIIGRAQRVVRWSIAPMNGIPLCHSHHRDFDSYKVDRNALIDNVIGKAEHRALVVKAQGIWDRQYPLAELTEALKRAKEKTA